MHTVYLVSTILKGCQQCALDNDFVFDVVKLRALLVLGPVQLLQLGPQFRVFRFGPLFYPIFPVLVWNGVVEQADPGIFCQCSGSPYVYIYIYI